ncbi:MAG: hypothetical protein FRX49_05183 [Trebouxia sp. A1-2]|nr:MAG: hypothetical protein FRX49_05183 [Trebouxia sp. A1-2]
MRAPPGPVCLTASWRARYSLPCLPSDSRDSVPALSIPSVLPMTSAVGMFCSSRDTTWGSGFGGTAAPWAGLACACMEAESVLIMLQGSRVERVRQLGVAASSRLLLTLGLSRKNRGALAALHGLAVVCQTH